MAYKTHIFEDKDILTHDDMNNIIMGIDELKLTMNNMTLVEKTKVIADITDFSINGFMRPAGTINDSGSGYKRTDYIDVSKYDTVKIHVEPRTASVSPAVWFDANKTYISGETASSFEEQDFEYSIPENAVYLVSSTLSNSNVAIYGTYMGIDFGLEDEENNSSSLLSVCYISSTGSDDNDGASKDSPIASFSQAKKILDPKGELIFLAGDYKNFSFDLSYFAKISTIGQVRLLYPKTEFTNASLVSGYSRVYSTPYTGTYNYYLWQMDVPDANTAITVQERHPLQRNRSYRLEHTRIYPVVNIDTSSTDLDGYLTTMENTIDKWTYYMDGTNLYFTCPNASNLSANPIVIPSSTVVKANTNRKVDISGLKVYFAGILTTGLSGMLNNIFAGYTTAAGAIRWDNTFDLILNNCEVAAGTNDGINGHTSGDITCYNCYGHDFSDDGESDHETCHIVQYGGLYEYNGNGCTPASGASGEYYNTIVRHCKPWDWVTDVGGTGFSAQGNEALIHCNGCYAEDCTIGFRYTGTGSFGSFVNCVASNDCTTGFSSGKQINCITLSEQQY